MGAIPILTTAAAIAASLIAIQGIDMASGGAFYLASISQLAQETTRTAESVAPPPEPQPAPPPPPPATEDTAQRTEIQPAPLPPPPSEGTRVIPPPGGEAGQPLPPPPERPIVPLEPIRPAPEPREPLSPERPQPPPPPEREPRPEIQPWAEGEEHEPQEFIDPREIQQVLREIKQMRNDIKRNVLRQIKKIGSESDAAQLNEILADLDRFQNILGNSSADASELRAAVEDFRDGQYWDRFNKIRARLEIPKELKQIALSLKRLERTIKTKAVKNLGFNLERVSQTIAEMKQNADVVQNHYASGDLEEAQEAMQEFHQGANPGEIESTIQRIREIKDMLKRVKDAAIRAEVDRILQEVIDTFNGGEYRDARETLDEYADDLRNLISKYLVSTGWGRKKVNREESFSRIRNLEGLVRSKLQEKAEPAGAPEPPPPAR